jgi:hypothetical protein
MFDYGTVENQHRYNQSTPPLYDLTKVHVPTALVHPNFLSLTLSHLSRGLVSCAHLRLWQFVGGYDDLADVQDVDRAAGLLPNVVLFHDEDKYNHFDPILAVDAAQKIYPVVVSLIAHYAPK